jgi:hypothetical protein
MVVIIITTPQTLKHNQVKLTQVAVLVEVIIQVAHQVVQG